MKPATITHQKTHRVISRHLNLFFRTAGLLTENLAANRRICQAQIFFPAMVM